MLLKLMNLCELMGIRLLLIKHGAINDTNTMPYDPITLGCC